MAKAPRLITQTPSAYSYPLLLKQLLHTPILYAPDQEIVYRDIMRYTYRDLYKRINKLANVLEGLDVGPGDTVAILDWDSHRYLECLFAVPSMGAIVHTVNVRLSPEQVLFTMNHAEDLVVITHQDFLPILESIQGQLETVKKYIVIKEGAETPKTSLPSAGEYEELLAQASDSYVFPDLDENTQATTFYTTGTTGDPKGVYYSHRQLVMHTLGGGVALAGYAGPGRFQSSDVYMPITPMFHVHAWGIPFLATCTGSQAGLSGSVRAAYAAQAVHQGESDLLSLRAHDSSHVAVQPRGQRSGPERMEGHHRRLRALSGPCQSSNGSRHRDLRRVRHVRDLPDSYSGKSEAGDVWLGYGTETGHPDHDRHADSSGGSPGVGRGDRKTGSC